MSKKTIRTLMLIDSLTLIFIIIQIQSIVAAYIHFSKSTFWSNEYDIYISSIEVYTGFGWAAVLKTQFGSFIKWMKIFLFFANIYVVIKKLILVFKRTIASRVAFSIFINLLFMGFKVAEAFWVWEMWMSV